jgi:regulator of ribonuclease activity A
MIEFTTADLSDDHPGVQVAAPVLASYGGIAAFGGRIETVSCFEDNSIVRETIETPGEGRVLVVDGGGSLRCALVGDQVATDALANGWIGLVVNGCVRDSAALADLDIAVLALDTHPRRSTKRGEGRRGETVRFAGIEFIPGSWLYADDDGVVVSAGPIH